MLNLLDVGMGYVSLDHYTLFLCFLAWLSLLTSFGNVLIILFVCFFVQAYLSVYV